MGPHGQTPAAANVVAFEVAGYNANSYSLLDQPSFLQAEIVAGERSSPQRAERRAFHRVLKERVQKVQRYSFQRPFSEVYRLAPGCDRWRRDRPTLVRPPRPFCPTGLLPRRVDYPDYVVRRPLGSSPPAQEPIAKPKDPWKDRSLTAIGPKLGATRRTELETIPSLELQTIANATNQLVNQPWTPGDSQLAPVQRMATIVDFGCDLTGFIGAKMTCRSKTRLVPDLRRNPLQWRCGLQAAWVASTSSATSLHRATTSGIL